tara:strand:+ start:96278 stop:97006 length:729 start_codon:yes stop_codon:yes gene_type:complete
MKILKFDTAELASKCLAKEIYQAIRENPSLNIGVATGRTMDSVYHNLHLLHQKERLDCSKVKAFALDEYIGLKKGHENSYGHYLNFHLFEPMGFSPSNTFVPDVHNSNFEEASSLYEEQIQKAGGLDFLIMGIGINGHIALNEPGSASDSRTRIVALSSKTIESNKTLFTGEEEIPNTALTMGIGTMMDAQKTYLIATGVTKSEIIRDLVEGDIRSSLPASYLKDHPNFTLILDHDSSKKIK